MGGGGSIQGMNNSLNNNKKLLGSSSYFRKEKSFRTRKMEYQSASKGFVDLKTASKEQLREIREKVLRDRRMGNLTTLLIFLLLLPLVIYLSLAYFETPKIQSTKKDNLELQQKSEKFEFYLSDVDNYLTKRKWHNAIFQYKKAAELFPKNYDAQYRIAYAYTYRCRNTKNNCQKATDAVKELRFSYPNNQEIIELEQVLIFAQETEMN